MAKTKKDAEKALEALVSLVGKLPGGTFSLKTEKVTHVSKEFEFLGHRLRKAKGNLRATPANPGKLLNSVSLIADKIAAHVYGQKQSKPCSKQIAHNLVLDAWYKIQSWKRAFKECDPEAINEATCYLEVQLETDWFQILGINSFQAANYSNPEAEWTIDES